MIKKSILFCLLIVAFQGYSQTRLDNEDSLKISRITFDFFDWYLNSIKEHEYEEFKPIFIEDKNGMTTLDFSKYSDNLRIHNFSVSLINSEIESYSDCIKNISTTKFSDFQKTKFIDLDEYELAKCDFGNYYRWIGGQEPCDGIKIHEINCQDKDKCLVQVLKFNYDSIQDRYYNWPYFVKIEIIRSNDVWLIDNINWK